MTDDIGLETGSGCIAPATATGRHPDASAGSANLPGNPFSI
jgi:hypothetical protein